MNIRTMTKQDIQPLAQQWNNDMHPDFYLREDVIASQVLQSQDLDLTCSFVAEEANQLVGGIIIKTWRRDLLPNYKHTAWITFLHVTKDNRNQEVGRQLLDHAIQVLRAKGYQNLYVGRDMNNLFCGTAEVFKSDGFFEAMGFTKQDTNYDMVRHVTNAPPLPLREVTDYDIHLSTEEDETLAKAFFHRAFPGRWEEEYLEYLRNGNTGKEFTFIHKDGKIIAFCRINHNQDSDNMYNTLFDASFKRLYGVGPLGVDPDYRGLSLGYDVTAYTINKAIEFGASDIIIDWTGLVDLYRKFGFDIWHSYAAYTIPL